MKIEQKHFDALINRTVCKWSDGKIDYLIMIDGRETDKPFKRNSDGIWLGYCEPVKTELYVKSAEEVYRIMYDTGVMCMKKGICMLENNLMWLWSSDMWFTCGMKYKDVENKYSYHPTWLEEKPIE